MTDIAFNSSFKKAFKKKIAGNSTMEARFWERVEIFKNNPFDPRLKTHKLSGKLKEFWAFSVEYDLRVVFLFDGQQSVLFADLGTHDEVY